MTTFTQFAARCKMRHDFADRIQVRYQHADGETYDTWVSGEEVIQRLHSADAEQRLRGMSRLNWDDLREVGEELPEAGKRGLRDHLHKRLADEVEDFLGDSLLGESLADAVHGRRAGEESDPEQQRWQARLHDDNFRAQVLALAWINLRGSFPDDEEGTEFDDWV